MGEFQNFTFSENEYDGMGAARFIASRPDGSSYQTDQYGRELWLVAPGGTTYDQIHSDSFFVETLEDFKAEIKALTEKEESKTVAQEKREEKSIANLKAKR